MNRLFVYFRDSGLRRKLMLSYALMIIIPILSLGLYSYISAKGYLKKQMLESMNNTVSQTALNLDQRMEKIGDFMDFMAYNPIVKKVTASELPDLLSYTKELNDNIEPTLWYYMSINQEIREVIFYSDYTGKQIGNFVYPSLQVQGKSWYEEARKSRNTQWHIEKDVLFAVHNIQKSDNATFAGELYVRLDEDLLFKSLEQVYQGQYGILITKPDGGIVYTGQEANHLTQTDVRKLIGESKRNFSMNGQDYLLTKSVLPHSGWTFYYYVPTEGLTVNTNSILTATGTVIVLCLVILMCMIWLFSRTLVRPILKLRQKIQLVETGHFDIPIQSDAKDEIGGLTRSFAHMVKKIRELIEEVYQARLLEKEAELKALQAQINPHFLYNTLSIINWRAIQVDAKDISRVANSLSRFYRTSLNKGKQFTRIQDEIQNIKAYLDIQLLMHEEEFEVVYDIPEEAYLYEIIHFILQPIVENAIVHGIDEREEGKGCLVIRVECDIDAEHIFIIVQDNGKGMNEEQVGGWMNTEVGGYGIRNVHDRIQLHYGEAYGISIHSVLGEGTEVRIKLPLRH
ncbi:two-component system sensor histidine kinase YesM [Paenibacillus shirakamiensis]|uniref:Two-component system sensor histidine kinase YesM n=1 Tax=Paenibacillus shirakamiensis TaxID=1265935 RepID=A0ABS4JEQ6_9BACL|nr:sensor histidine kinase [Paenibacillus shirakamiensis]MBP2000199.1 two-component system sensor histidine kinase YesM [Paenibacillus shirakamiensis]